MTRSCPYSCDQGVIFADDDYVAEQLRKLPAQMPAELRAQKAAAFRHSVRPCPRCRPEQYELWRGGHLESGHTCSECSARRGKRRTAKAASA